MTEENIKKVEETKEGGRIKMIKSKSGITLIALVVTIVVLLILAGVSISLILDNNGIIQKSKEAKRKYGQAKENEEKQLDSAFEWIDEQVTGKVSLAKVPVDTKAKKNGTINGEKGNSNNPTIPEGYTPIDADISEWGDGSTVPTQDSVDHGLVIRDDNNNEWVWIPVDSTALSTMCETTSEEKKLCGTTVTTNKYSKSEIISGIERITPGETISPYYREPDLVVGSGEMSYDAKEEYYNTILGFDSKEKMADAFVDDYNEMIASIEKYGGFYIGRYELSSSGVKKKQQPLEKTRWYDLYNACKKSELQASDKVKTQMIWGCQWDVTCNFITNKGDKRSITDSNTWGNYSSSTGSAAVKVTENGTEINKYGSKQYTGYSEYWKANNIYDLAGNCYEWTQEAGGASYRACRGGSYECDGSEHPVSYRFNSGGPIVASANYIRYASNFNNKIEFLLVVQHVLLIFISDEIISRNLMYDFARQKNIYRV